MRKLTIGSMRRLQPNKPGRVRWFFRASRGQSIAEFAIILPVLLLIVFGILDLGRMYFAYISVVNGAREGARWAAGYPTDQSGIIQHANQEVSASGPASVFTNCPCNQGDTAEVTVTAPFQLLTTYIFGGGTITLQATDKMEVFGK